MSNMKKEVMILTDAGQIGMAIARRMGYGKKIVVGDLNPESTEAVCRILNEPITDRSSSIRILFP